MKALLVALTMLLALSANASAGTSFSSDALGFMAVFPEPPLVHPEQDAETDDARHVASRAILVEAGQSHVYSAVVVVERYVVPHTLDDELVLRAYRDGCVKGFDTLTQTQSTPIVLDGHKGLAFRYAGPQGRGGAVGLVVIVEGTMPRIYVVFGMVTPKAAPSLVAAVDEWVQSFHLLSVP